MCVNSMCLCVAAPRFLNFPLAALSTSENRYRFLLCVPGWYWGIRRLPTSICACLCFASDSVNGTQLAQLSAYDDDGDQVAFQLFDAAGGPFSLTPSGMLYVDTEKGWLNYEVQTLFTLGVQLREVSNGVAGASLLYASQGNTTTVVNVLDVREAPRFVFTPGNYAVDEESVFPTIVTPYLNGSYIRVFDEDVGNDSALSVTVQSWVTGVNSSYFEVVNATGAACRGQQNCVLRVKTGSPRMNFDSPDLVRLVNVSLTVTDSTGLNRSTSVFNVAVMNINQGAVY